MLLLFIIRVRLRHTTMSLRSMCMHRNISISTNHLKTLTEVPAKYTDAA